MFCKNKNRKRLHALPVLLRGNGARKTSPLMSQIFVGDDVEAKFRGKSYRQGQVTDIRSDGTVDIRYDTGEIEYRVHPSNIRIPTNDAFAAAGERTGKVMRATGKNMKTFGDKVLKHLMADDGSSPGADAVRVPRRCNELKYVIKKKMITSQLLLPPLLSS